MLDLETGVHLHEVQLRAVEVEDELDRAGPDVADLVGQRFGVVERGLAKLVGQQSRAGFFEDLLLATLHAAVTQAEDAGHAQAVAQDLYLDVAEAPNVPLDVEVTAAEGALGFAGHGEKGVAKVVPGPRPAGCPDPRRREPP